MASIRGDRRPGRSVTTSRRARVGRAGALLLLGATLGAVVPADAASPSPLAPTDPTRLPIAMSSLPPEASVFAFTDWTAIKASVGHPDVTSASPEEERLRSCSRSGRGRPPPRASG